MGVVKDVFDIGKEVGEKIVRPAVDHVIDKAVDRSDRINMEKAEREQREKTDQKILIEKNPG